MLLSCKVLYFNNFIFFLMRKYYWRNVFIYGVGKGFKIVLNKWKDFCLYFDDVKGSI